MIHESNQSLVGTEIKDTGYIILKDGVYNNEKGEVIDIEQLSKDSKEFPKSRIVKYSLMPNFIPSSIVEILTDETGGSYITPEMILVNNSLCILTKNNGRGWKLSDQDMAVISFEKYESDVVANQNLIIGYVKDGIMYEGKEFEESAGKYSFSPSEEGEYFFYFLSGSSDYLSLKSGKLEIK